MTDSSSMQDLPPTVPTTPSTASEDAKYDPSYYTWSNFFRSVTGNATREEMLKYAYVRSIVNEERDCQRCDEAKAWIFKNSPVVRFMQEQIGKLGGDLNEDNVRCRRCDILQPGGMKQGAFDKDFGILLCANNLRNTGHQEDVMAHEMVHAYDYLKFDYDTTNLKHLACTEIRASMLSGECRFTREFFKNRQWKFTRGFQDCVRRRATLSVAGNRLCKDQDQASKIVAEVWGSCFADTRPFDEIYR